MDVFSRLVVASTGAVALFIVGGTVIGCRPIDCNETATCDIVGDDVVIANDSASEASDDVVGMANDGTFDSSDVSDETADASDGAASVKEGAADRPTPTDTGNDGPAPTDTGAEADGGREAQPEAAPEAGPKCGSNVLVPTGEVASSVMATTDPASAAVDGILSTRWDSLHADPQWIDLDFGAPVFVDRVRILWQHCATNYDLQVSNDAATWTTMKSILGNTSGSELAPSDWSGAVDTTGLAGVGRYLRVNAPVRCLTGSGDSIWEMQVYGDTNTSCAP